MQNFRQMKNYIWTKTIWIIISALAFPVAMVGFMISNILQKAIINWLVFLAISLLSFILSIIYFSVKDPINNVTKYRLKVLLEYCFKSHGFVVYSEFIAYISKLCNVISENSNLSRTEPEKIVARAWRNISKSKSIIRNQEQYRKLCKILSQCLEEKPEKKPNEINEQRVSIIINDIENECNDSDDFKIFKSIFKWIEMNPYIILNLISCILIIVGFIFTSYKISPLDTYLYGSASILLVIYALITEFGKKLDC